MGKKNQYLDNLVPHLKEKYGAKQAEAIITSARKHFEAICQENAGEPAAYDMHPKVIWGRTQTLGKGGDCCDFRMSIKK